MEYTKSVVFPVILRSSIQASCFHNYHLRRMIMIQVSLYVVNFSTFDNKNYPLMICQVVRDLSNNNHDEANRKEWPQLLMLNMFGSSRGNNSTTLFSGVITTMFIGGCIASPDRNTFTQDVTFANFLRVTPPCTIFFTIALLLDLWLL